MKKQVSLLTLTAALLLGACSTYEEVPATSGDGATAVGFLADIAPREQSRADINVDFETGLTGTWNGEDNLGVLANDFTQLLQFTYATDSKAFTGSLTGTAGTWAYRAFYPHNGNAAVSGTTVTVPFSALRTQNGNKYNSEFDIMAADAITHNDAEPGKTPEGSAVKFNLHRITSILALKLQGDAASEKIASVMLTSEKPIASEQLTFTVPSDPNATYDPSAINPTLVAEGTSATGSPISIDSEHITVTYADGTAPSADYSETFFNVLPDDSYGALTFSACTDKGNAASFTITRSTPVVANWVYTVEQTASFTKAAAPTVEWLGHEDLTTPVELAESGNSADIRVSAPGGIKSMQVDIASAPLATLLPLVNLAESMDLTSPATEEMASMLAQLGFPTPAQLLNQQHVYFQIGGLIDMLAMVCAEMTETTNSDFKFTVTDNAGQETVITLKYVKTVVSPITYNNDADLWANTASFTLNIPADATSVSVQYKKSTASDTEWQTAEITGNNTKAEIKPDWGTQFTAADWTTPNSVQPFWRITEGTGVFANNTYDYKLTVDGTEYKGQFTTKTDQIIPEGNMENTALPCFILQDASKTSETWGSGNNKVLSACWLCQQADGNSGKCAYLTSGTQNTYVFGKLLTAGNLFFGQFTQNGTGGDVRFGQIYPWKSRPSAMRVSYKAEVDNVDYVNTTTTVNIPKNSPDKARIFVAVVDWTGPHTVTSTLEVKSGLPATVIGSWDPETTTDPGEGKIIGYGSLWIEKGKTDWQTIDIPINYYDKTAKPTDGKYSLVISCACNAYGEFFNGCSTNKLWVDDFEWVY
ncbi:PCMD domain-containing protein [Alistipes finegoldii]|uniref:PCMD domain-containing protein n=1 Tax=Alistipes finegoldii TaxID=214856 RepID=UPI00242C4FBA|nr:PCMD domain-containing protein [Alistipes finegoldii]